MSGDKVRDLRRGVQGRCPNPCWACDEAYGTRRVRFWAWVNGAPVRLSLRPGESLSWATGRTTDEGWRREGFDWAADDAGVTRYRWANERDCDGRADWGTEDYCPADRLAVIEPPGWGFDRSGRGWDGLAWPAWVPVDRTQRDHSAEAAGY